MPKYLLLKHYTGGPEPLECAPMNEWTPQEFNAHIEFQHTTIAMLKERGEFVDAQGLSADGAWVQFKTAGAPPFVLDGPFAETKELIAGWFMIDVESQERAYEVAAFVSSAPGQGGRPIHEWIEVRQAMEAPAVVE